MYNHSLVTENCTNWASRVTDLLFSLGFGECWFQQYVGDMEAFMSIASQRIKDQYLQQWHGNMESSTRARTYRALRPNFTSQAYLQCIHSFDHLKSLARFETSSHRLRVETGRWDKPPVLYDPFTYMDISYDSLRMTEFVKVHGFFTIWSLLRSL